MTSNMRDHHHHHHHHLQLYKFMGNQTHTYPIQCKPSCCTSKPTTTSTSTSSSSPETDNLGSSFSNLIHTMVQARLERMINNERANGVHNHHHHQHYHHQRRKSNNLIFLLAMGKSSCNPKGDFRESIYEVITKKGMKEPKELRCLLDCYISLNSPEHRRVILETFLEVCSSLFWENSH